MRTSKILMQKNLRFFENYDVTKNKRVKGVEVVRTLLDKQEGFNIVFAFVLIWMPYLALFMYCAVFVFNLLNLAQSCKQVNNLVPNPARNRKCKPDLEFDLKLSAGSNIPELKLLA